MSFEFIKKLPTPEEIRNQYPVDAEIQALKEKRDAEIRDVFTGKSDKFLAIIGPCSADNEDAVCDYLLRLRKVQEKIEDKVLIIPRVYTNKPRTTGEGYKGMVHQPDPEKKPSIMHRRNVRSVTFRICFLFSRASSSATEGISITEAEAVSAEGKRISGSAIPVKTP